MIVENNVKKHIVKILEFFNFKLPHTLIAFASVFLFSREEKLFIYLFTPQHFIIQHLKNYNRTNSERD